MKAKTIIVAMILASCLFDGCETPCPMFGNDSDVYPASIVKFGEGQDMSNKVYAYFYRGQGNVISYMENRPIALYNGYYLMQTIGAIDTIQMAFLSCTYDDLEASLLPEDWKEHWQNYFDTVHNPYREIYEIYGSTCDKDNYGIPFYCSSCSNTFHIDTTMLNRMLEENPTFLTNSEYIFPIYIQNQ